LTVDLPSILSGGRSTLVIGEVAQAHDGSLGTAHAFIDAIADAGADAVKFQTHIAAEESTAAEPWRVRFSKQDDSRFDYWRRMEFTEPQWHGLKEHADERGLAFLSSPFSVAAVELLERVGVPAWKVASGEVTNPVLIDAMLATGKPILVSSGMSSIEELDRVVAQVRARGSQVAVLQCSTAYPCPPEQVGLNLIPEYLDRWGCTVGLSDHSGTIFPSLAAVTLGARVLEVHVTLSRKMFGPDVIASITDDQLAELVRGVRFIEAMQANPVDKDAAAGTFEEMRRLFGKSVVARQPLVAGTVLEPAHLAYKKPGTGTPVEQVADLLGRRLRRDLAPDDLVLPTDLEPST
jgi:N,N'-diacetyllegionaminate synthase